MTSEKNMEAVEAARAKFRPERITVGESVGNSAMTVTCRAPCTEARPSATSDPSWWYARDTPYGAQKGPRLRHNRFLRC